MKTPSPWARRTIAAIAIALLCVACLLAARASGQAVGSHGQDVERRWQEMQYLLRGIDPIRLPFDLLASNTPSDGLPRPLASPLMQLDLVVPGKGSPASVYPPWAHTLALPIGLAPDHASAKRLMLGLNLALYAALLWWAWGRLAPIDRTLALAVVAALASFAAFRASITVGNYGIVVAALLAGTLVLTERGKPLAAGVLLGIAMLKPTLAGPFVLPLLVERRHWPALLGAGATVGLATLAFARYTRTDPIDSFLATFRHLEHFVAKGGGVVALLDPLSGIVELVQGYWSVLVLALGAWASWRVRRRTLLERFAVSATVALLWTYHRRYDETILVFLLLPLAAAAWPGPGPVTRRVLVSGVAAAALWFACAAPDALLPEALRPAVQAGWVACLVWLLGPASTDRAPADADSAAPDVPARP